MGQDFLVFLNYGAAPVALAWVLPGYMHRVYAGERVILSPVLAPVGAGLLRHCQDEPGPRAGLEG